MHTIRAAVTLPVADPPASQHGGYHGAEGGSIEPVR
jgi:hypothetical protein